MLRYAIIAALVTYCIAASFSLTKIDQQVTRQSKDIILLLESNVRLNQENLRLRSKCNLRNRKV